MADEPMATGWAPASAAQDAPRPGRAGAASLLELARGAAAGRGSALEEFYNRRFGLVFLTARRTTGRDEHFCLDVVQETFVRIMHAGAALARLEDDGHVDRWLVRVAQTAALDLLRRDRRRATRERAAPRATTDGASFGPSADGRIEWLTRQLAALPAEERDLLRLRASGLTLHVVAEMAGATVGAVHGRIRRIILGLARSGKEADRDA